MDQTIARAKTCTTDCNYPEKKLRQILDSTEDEANFHMMQSAFLYQLGVHTMPKSLHCLSMRLTVEYFKSSSRDMEHLQPSKTGGSKLFHYVIFSRNVLAVSVAINSTVVNSKVWELFLFSFEVLLWNGLCLIAIDYLVCPCFIRSLEILFFTL